MFDDDEEMLPPVNLTGIVKLAFGSPPKTYNSTNRLRRNHRHELETAQQDLLADFIIPIELAPYWKEQASYETDYSISLSQRIKAKSESAQISLEYDPIVQDGSHIKDAPHSRPMGTVIAVAVAGCFLLSMFHARFASLCTRPQRSNKLQIPCTIGGNHDEMILDELIIQ